MHVRPGADAYRIDALVLQELTPIVVDLGNVELVGHHPPRLAAAVGHRDDLQPFNCLKSGDVAVAGILSRAN